MTHNIAMFTKHNSKNQMSGVTSYEVFSLVFDFLFCYLILLKYVAERSIKFHSFLITESQQRMENSRRASTFLSAV